MKTKDCERLTEEYEHQCNNIQIGIDDTDHLVFICNKCKKPLEVIEIKNSSGDYSHNGKENRTQIFLVCHNCKTLGKRKFYWKYEEGKYCYQRTYNQDLKEGVTQEIII